jgi:hypothetical protein
MAKHHFSVQAPHPAAPTDAESDGRSTQLLLGVTGSVGYLSLLAFVVLRIAGT